MLLNLFGDRADHLRSKGLALVGQVSNILERVVVEAAAVDVVDTHQETEALEVVRLRGDFVNLSVVSKHS